MHSHDGYAPHSHGVRAGHRGVSQAGPDRDRVVIASGGGVRMARDDAATALADRTSARVILRSGIFALAVEADLSVTTAGASIPAMAVEHHAVLLAVAAEITAYAQSIRDGNRHLWQ